MHTGGEPLRIVTSGYPKLQGSRLLDKRRDALANHDAFRRLLMHEPRGHAEMYGAVLVEPDDPAADLAVLFLHGQGYRSEEHTSELQSLMRISYAVFCLKKKKP